MLSTNPESVAAYSSAAGAGVLLVGGVLTALAYWAMVRIGRLPEDERVLR
jgi:tight adherence protein B